MKLLLFFIFLAFSFSSPNWAQSDKRIIYKYKKYEKFDFNSLDINADATTPGDISVVPRERKIFKNKLPSKPDFFKEAIKTFNDAN